MTADQAKLPSSLLSQLADRWRTFRDYLGAGRRRQEPVADRAALGRFLNARASHVAQTSLYGYMRTRAGMRYPELFDDDGFVASINMAKWHVWLACLSDLGVYAGGLLVRQRPEAAEWVASLMRAVVDDILRDTGVPEEAGDEFSPHADRVRERIARCEWGTVSEGEDAFTESPAALVHWAPIVDELKQLDEEIVRNSVRFRWQEVRRNLRQSLDAADVLRDATGDK
jgi:hypothetical protein